MNNHSIIFVSGKNPKPPGEQHRALLWRTLLEEVGRADPGCYEKLFDHFDNFKLLA